MLEEKWSTKGAQEFPFGVVVVNEDVIEMIIDESGVIYIGGPTHDMLVCFLSGDS